MPPLAHLAGRNQYAPLIYNTTILRIRPAVKFLGKFVSGG